MWIDSKGIHSPVLVDSTSSATRNWSRIPVSSSHLPAMAAVSFWLRSLARSVVPQRCRSLSRASAWLGQKINTCCSVCRGAEQSHSGVIPGTPTFASQSLNPRTCDRSRKIAVATYFGTLSYSFIGLSVHPSVHVGARRCGFAASFSHRLFQRSWCILLILALANSCAVPLSSGCVGWSLSWSISDAGAGCKLIRHRLGLVAAFYTSWRLCLMSAVTEWWRVSAALCLTNIDR